MYSMYYTKPMSKLNFFALKHSNQSRKYKSMKAGKTELVDKTTYESYKQMKSYCKQVMTKLSDVGNCPYAFLNQLIDKYFSGLLDKDKVQELKTIVDNAKQNKQLLDKKFINKILHPKLLSVLDMTNPKQRQAYMYFTDEVFKVGLCLGTYYGITLGLEDFLKGRVDNSKLPTPESAKNVVETEKMFKSLLDASLNKLKENKSSLIYIVDSGARGSWEQVKQMLVGRGFVDAGDGRVLYIRGNYLEGLDQADMLLTGIGAIKAVYDKSVNTYRPGYLTRQLMYCAVSELLSDDCQTTEYAEYSIANEKQAKAFIGKYYLDEQTGKLKQVTFDNYKDIVGKKLKFRSVLYCNHRWHICKTCFGDTYVTRHYTRVAAIGAQILGERATQLSMRAFHTGGSVSFTTEAASFAAEYPEYLEVDDKVLITKQPCEIEIPETYLTASGIVLLATNIKLKYDDGLVIEIPLVKGDRLFVHKTRRLHSHSKIAEMGIQHIGTQIAILESVLQRKDIVTNPELFTHMMYSLFSDVADYDFGYFELLVAHLLWYNDKPMIAYTGKEVRAIKQWTKIPLKLVPHLLSWRRGFGYERLKLAIEQLLLKPHTEMPDGFLETVTFSQWPIDPFDIADRAKPDYIG